MKKTRFALFQSIICLMLCLSMLVGTTFAWFTDTVTSNQNVIAAGSLDVELEYWTGSAWAPVTEQTNVFEENTLWEPGHTEVVYLRISNAGNLALNYKFGVNIVDETPSVNQKGDPFKLSQFIRFGAVAGNAVFTAEASAPVTYPSREAARDALTQSWSIAESYTDAEALYPAGNADGKPNEKLVTLVVYMPEDVKNEANYATGAPIPEIKLGLQLVATQQPYEQDSFNGNYDTDSELPEFPFPVGGIADSATGSVTTDGEGKVDQAVTLQGSQSSATIPEGVQLENGAQEVTLTVKSMSQTDSNLQLGDNEEMLSLDVHVAGVAANNDVPMVIQLVGVLPVGLNIGNYSLYHVENGQTNAMTAVATAADVDTHNEFYYDPATGNVTVAMKSFSEIAFTMNTVNAWNGDFDFAWFTPGAGTYVISNADQLAALGAIVGGMPMYKVSINDETGVVTYTKVNKDGPQFAYTDDKGNHNYSFANETITLIADINIGDTVSDNGLVFYPIGYNSSDGKYEKTGVAVTTGFYNFCGTFDGNGHTIANFYHNTWEMKGDNNYYDATLQYYRDGMGLFGRVYGGTIKNLTVKNFSSDGEYTTTGVIAAYADGATFENIAIFNCNPRVYNIGNGGIVGCVGWYAKEANLKTTFTNITVDNSNKISALWGSYDVACGGIVGQYYPTSGQTSAGTPKNGGIEFVNCHISAVMDVYNDVCANYQYYAYRYTGMLIGSIRENTTTVIDGVTKTIPDMTGISATGCTVNYGDWNDYYYCEFEKNGHPSYSGPNDYKFSRIPHSELNFTDSNGNGVVDANERASVTGCKHDHTDVEDNQAVFLPFYQLFTGYGWGVNSIGLEKYSGVVTNLDITEGDQEESVVKFEPIQNAPSSFNRGQTITIGELFKAVEQVKRTTENGTVEIKDANVQVTVSPVGDNSNVGAIYRANTTNWTQGTLEFNGSGTAAITITDYYFCKSTTIYITVTDPDFMYRVGNQNKVSIDAIANMLTGRSATNVTIDCGDHTVQWDGEKFSGTGVITIKIDGKAYSVQIVDAVNATSATSATSNNVVLLNDCGFSSLEVSGGYTLYGNGFTLTCGSDAYAKDFGYAFVNLTDGILDNVQIVCPNFDYAALYKSNLTSSDNRSYTDSTGTTRYYNARSGVMVSGNSKILNSRISGGRAAVNVTGGNCVIDNSRIELGAVASLLIGSANSVTLRDVTLVQKPTASTYDPSKTLMGFSVLFVCDANGDVAPVTLEGTLVQNAWVDENDKQYVPSAGQSIVSTVLGKTEYLHDLDGDGTKESLNLGFAYMPESLTSKVNTTTITDNRTNKADVPYDYAEVSILNGKTYVYSYKNTNGTADSFKTEAEYVPNKYGDIITVTYSDTSDGLEASKSFGTDGWVYELNVDLDKRSGYKLDFSKLSMTVNGVAVTDYKVNGGNKPSSVAITAGGVTYTLTATVDDKEYTATYKVTGTETSKESPSLVAQNYEAGLCVASSYGGTWHGAAPALEGIQIKYWSVAEKQYKTINLSDYTPTTKGQLNGTDTTWTYSPDNGDFTLTVTGGQVHSSNKVYAMPVVCDGKLYFVAAKSNGLVNSGNSARTIPVTYTFKDNNNGDVLTFSHTWSVAENKDAQYKYSDFCNGTLTKLESSSGGGSCVTPDTLVTLADGTQVRVDSLTGNEELLVWNMETGKLDSAPIMFVDSEEEAEFEIVHLYFSDGTDVKVIYEHGFWDYDLNKYVYLDRYADKYIGHTFAKQNGDELEQVVLTDVVIETEVTTAWSPVTAGHLCYFVNGMLSMPGGVGGLFNIFDVDPETMTYDLEAMQKDIETYGLFTYEELNAICPLSEEMFNAAGGAYLKISIGKGNLTMDELIAMINRYSKFFE